MKYFFSVILDLAQGSLYPILLFLCVGVHGHAHVSHVI